MAGKKPSKNNPEVKNKSKPKYPKRIESSICEKCNEKCKEYFDYIERLKRGSIGIGILCKK